MLAATPTRSSTVAKSVILKTSESPSKDPSCPVKGMYRLLDLITEQGSSGLGTVAAFRGRLDSAHDIPTVDKIVIDQESLQAFINALSPGAYSSITRVNFKILDDCLLKPIGVYGSREEIVRFFLKMGAIDDETCVSTWM